MNASKTKEKTDLLASLNLQKLHLGGLNPWLLIASGAVLLVVLVALFFTGGNSQHQNEATLDRAKQTMGQLGGVVQNFRRVLEDQQVQELAVFAASDPGKLSNLQQYMSGRIPDLIEIELFK